MASELNLQIIDSITEKIVGNIDNGFELLEGSVMSLVSWLITIDLTLIGLFMALGAEQRADALFVRKTLFYGFILFVIHNFNSIVNAIFETFAAFGLKISETAITQEDIFKPSKIIEAGADLVGKLLKAAWDRLEFTWTLVSGESLIVALMIAILAFVVLFAFAYITLQLFVAVIEFKVTSLIAFVLVPFALFGRTSFLAEKAMTFAFHSGIRIMLITVLFGLTNEVFNIHQIPAADITWLTAISVMIASMGLMVLIQHAQVISDGFLRASPSLHHGHAESTAKTPISAGKSAAGMTWKGLSASVIGAGMAVGTASLAAASAIGRRVGGSANNSGQQGQPQATPDRNNLEK